MKFLTAASLLTLSSSALAAIRQVQLFAQSSNQEINNFGISSLHEGAGINYLFLAAPGTAQTLQFDDATNTIFVDLGSQPPARQSLVVAGNIVQLSVAGEPLNVQIAEDGLVSFPGSDSIAAAKNINDPYRYSEELFAVVTNGAEGSIPFQIVAKFVDEAPSSSSAAPETTAAPTAEETAAYGNKTIVTVYTTYCPEFTTLTLTVCDKKCAPTEIATSGYVTVPDVKVVTTTETQTTLQTVTKGSITAPPAPVTTAAGPVTSAEEHNSTSTVFTPIATVTSYEGAANMLTGSFAIGVAAIVGMIL
ncbi:Cell wall protein PGA30 [Candida viswanathii]|uniref:Cell wall protein PGA30 n=1 Tax=Candida viswanathii TaxID=5486 RepID=A0A367Y9U3_9ASCO|nr:Cell wall protein PGA30 [Candida viswanathii]